MILATICSRSSIINYILLVQIDLDLDLPGLLVVHIVLHYYRYLLLRSASRSDVCGEWRIRYSKRISDVLQ